MTRLPLLLALCATPALAQPTAAPYYTPTPDGSARIDWPTVCRLAVTPYPAGGPRSPVSGNVTAARIEWEFVQAIVRTAKERGRPGCNGDKAR